VPGPKRLYENAKRYFDFMCVKLRLKKPPEPEEEAGKACVPSVCSES
jgi:hypothetical protein